MVWLQTSIKQAKAVTHDTVCLYCHPAGCTGKHIPPQKHGHQIKLGFYMFKVQKIHL